jgi:hypothetical protein
MNNNGSVRTIAARLAMGASVALAVPAIAGELWLAPGKSVTIFDAADPSVRLVITAPANGPLDLAPLLDLKPGESVHSIATRVQMRSAGAVTIGTDGSVALNPMSAPALAGAPMPEGGVLVREATQWRLHATDPAPATRPAAGVASSERTLISKPGATSAQASRDIQQCRTYAERAAAQFLNSAAKVAAYNNAMQSCLRSFGYTIHSPAA